MGNNFRTPTFSHSQKNQVTIAEEKTEIDFHPQGTSKSCSFILPSF